MKQTVIGGFSTEFSFRVVPRDEDKSPGPCKWVDHSEGKCARRGGDGFAFVVQNYSPKALGSGGGGLGYSGISNAVVVEFDTWFDTWTQAGTWFCCCVLTYLPGYSLCNPTSCASSSFVSTSKVYLHERCK